MDLPSNATLIAIALGIGMSVLTLALAVLVIVRMPRDYFANPRQQMLPPRKRPILRLAYRIGKNVLGWILILLGIALALPGMPGEGVLTVLIGIVLIDFPGKSRMEQRIIRIGWIRRALNYVRARYHRAPLKKNP